MYYATIVVIALDGGIRSNCCTDHFQLRLLPLHPNLLPTNSTNLRLESVISQLSLILTMESPHVSSLRLFGWSLTSSSVSDRLLEVTGTISATGDNKQVLDKLKVERERGVFPIQWRRLNLRFERHHSESSDCEHVV